MPDTWVGLAVALLAIVPGFIATATWARARTWRGPSTDLRTVLQSLALSAAIQVVISPLTILWIVPIRDHLDTHPWRVALWFFLTVLVLPLVAGVAVARTTDLLFDPRQSGHQEHRRAAAVFARLFKEPSPPSPWDWTFATGVPDGRFVLVQFQDGSQVGGVFAQGSIALTSPEQQGLYLADEWLLDDDGNFTAPLPDSRGIMIPTVDQVRWVRILASNSEPAEGERDG